MDDDTEQRGPFEVTEAAKRELETAARSHGLWRFGVRVRLVGKDTSRGFELSFDELPERGEVILKSAGMRLFMDEDALTKVSDPVVIDWAGRGFIFRARRP
ncbi:MAG: hypothetical protein CVU56_03825 [Deltaproteobacteria bacterium HGW-Deltaproteobacteria-14]|jgi:Fe-S cluster assembly iron-binding protein IscA|nr:MAG: hypothetical protein CVU56_03825 [Deltaproteobacteria bacterium HGW-Deltaproteobacteria-14]